MGRELFGAVLVGTVVTLLCFPVFKKTTDGARKIFVSLLAVSLAYFLCEEFSFSGAIASVTWGGLRGGLCVALAMSTKNMLQSDVYYIVLGGTFAIVFFTTVIQGMTIPRLYHSIEKKISHHHGEASESD